jgi:hypothetical protein
MAQSPLVTPDNTTRKKLTRPEFPLEALAMWGRSLKSLLASAKQLL